MEINMYRSDPTLNMNRFYTVELTRGLLGHHGVERHWGRAGTLGQTRLDWYDKIDIAESELIKIVQQKLSKGYVLKPFIGGNWI